MLNNVIDISHHQGEIDFERVKQTGIVGVLHKATEGLTWYDPMYEVNRAMAHDAGLLWGAYHWGHDNDPWKEAEWFLEVAQPNRHTLLALDYEEGSDQMNIDQARMFVLSVASQSCKIYDHDQFPGFYSGSLIKSELGDSPPDPILSNCWFWLPQYGDHATDVPPTWPTWTMWQYTDKGLVDGIDANVDRNKLNGDTHGLYRLWGF